MGAEPELIAVSLQRYAFTALAGFQTFQSYRQFPAHHTYDLIAKNEYAAYIQI